jgi:hypothetical protein
MVLRGKKWQNKIKPCFLPNSFACFSKLQAGFSNLLGMLFLKARRLF